MTKEGHEGLNLASATYPHEPGSWQPVSRLAADSKLPEKWTLEGNYRSVLAGLISPQSPKSLVFHGLRTSFLAFDALPTVTVSSFVS